MVAGLLGVSVRHMHMLFESTGQSFSQTVTAQRIRLSGQLLREAPGRPIAEVARACGVAIPDDLLAHILNIPAIMPNQMSSTAQDLARGKPSEIDFLNGYVVRKGAELGIATPTNKALQVMVKLAQRGKELSRK